MFLFRRRYRHVDTEDDDDETSPTSGGFIFCTNIRLFGGKDGRIKRKVKEDFMTIPARPEQRELMTAISSTKNSMSSSLPQAHADMTSADDTKKFIRLSTKDDLALRKRRFTNRREALAGKMKTLNLAIENSGKPATSSQQELKKVYLKQFREIKMELSSIEVQIAALERADESELISRLAQEQLSVQKMASDHMKESTKGITVDSVTKATDDFNDTVNEVNDLNAEVTDILKGGEGDAINRTMDSDEERDELEELMGYAGEQESVPVFPSPPKDTVKESSTSYIQREPAVAEAMH